jgi:hypothetical protein
MKLAWYFQSRESREEYTRILGKLSPQIKEDLRSEFDQMLTDYLADITADKKEAEEYRSWLDGSSRPPKFCPACERGATERWLLETAKERKSLERRNRTKEWLIEAMRGLEGR